MDSTREPLRIEFDRGTLLVRGAGEGALEPLPGVRWDPRVGCHRAPARFHGELIAALGERAVDLALAPALVETVSAPTLRPYQAAALDAWTLAGRRGVVVLPTGAGKTRVAVAAMAEAGCSALCLVPTRVLLGQWRATLERELGIAVGVLGDGEREVRAVTVATFESGWRHMASIGNRFGMLVADEAHHFGLGVRDEALEMCTAGLRLGLTATPPAGEAAARLEDLVGPVVYALAIEDLTGSFLAALDLVELRLGMTADERREHDEAWGRFRAAFDRFIELVPPRSGAAWADFLRWAARTAQGRAGVDGWRRARRLLAWTEAKRRAVSALLERHREARVLVFTADKHAAYAIARENLVMPITADVKRAEREAALEAFRAGRIRALVSARVLNEGIDVPDAEVGIVVGGAQGEREHVQRIGRLLRPAPGKRALVYELVTRGTAEVGAMRRKRHGIRPGGAGAL